MTQLAITFRCDSGEAHEKETAGTFESRSPRTRCAVYYSLARERMPPGIAPGGLVAVSWRRNTTVGGHREES